LSFLGEWPLGVAWCNVYVTCDVLACSSSIMHMCCISLGRYLGIRHPLRTRHHYSTMKLVCFKIAIVWFLSFLVSFSVTLLGKFMRPNHNNTIINARWRVLLHPFFGFYYVHETEFRVRNEPGNGWKKSIWDTTQILKVLYFSVLCCSKSDNVHKSSIILYLVH